MQQVEDKDSTSPKLLPAIGGKLTSGFASVASMVVGAIVFDVNVRRTAYGNLARQGIFNELQKGPTEELGGRVSKIVKWAADHVIPESSQRSWLSRFSLVPSKSALALKEIQQTYRKEVRQEFVKHDLVSYVDYWSGLHRNQKIELGLRVASAAAFSFGIITYIGGYLKRKHQSRAERDTSEQHSR